MRSSKTEREPHHPPHKRTYREPHHHEEVISTLMAHHQRSMTESLIKLRVRPWSTLAMAAIIGIALALPTGFYSLLNNISSLFGQRQETGWISLFVRPDINANQTEELAGRLRLQKSIQSVEHIRREAALEEFKQISGFRDALEGLKENPLPELLLIRPHPAYQSTEELKKIVDYLTNLPETDIVRLDLEWVRRLQAILAIAQRSTLIIGSLLGLAVLLIIGNVIRLDIENRREEIAIIKLIGGSNDFIRRPFLYYGVWHSLLGGLTAWLLVTLSLLSLANPVEHLASLYNSHFVIQYMPPDKIILLLASSVALGLVGSWLAVTRHLRNIDKQDTL